MSLTPLPPPPPLLEKYIFFALPFMSGPLPAELNFRENTVYAYWLMASTHFVNVWLSR